MTLTIGHTPDADDAFMFAGMSLGKIRDRGLKVRLILKDIETLNRMAMKKSIEVAAVSFHAYAHIRHAYALLPCGASFGYKYGPVLVAKKRLSRKALRGEAIAVPGTTTSAFLLLRIFLGEFPFISMPFDAIPDAVRRGDAAAGLLIHEAQLTYKNEGLVKLLDCGQEWTARTRLPVPLGGNAVRINIGLPAIRTIHACLLESIRWGLDHPREALAAAMEHARGADERLVETFVKMYVNRRTLSYGPRERKAVALLLRMGYECGHLKELIEPAFLPA